MKNVKSFKTSIIMIEMVLIRTPKGYVESIPRAMAPLHATFTLDGSVTQGVMPASAYLDMYGRRTTAPELPPSPTIPTVRLPMRPGIQDPRILARGPIITAPRFIPRWRSRFSLG